MDPAVRSVAVNGQPCRVWEGGSGPALFCLPSPIALLRWSPFHDALAQHARVVACSLPGYPGSVGHDAIDDHLAWCLTARDLLTGAGFQPGDTLVAASAPAALAADVAALWPDLVGSLVLLAPFGLYDAEAPGRDMFAVASKNVAALVSAEPARYAAQVVAPTGPEAVEWSIMLNRSTEASARYLWPFGDTGLVRRLGRVRARTLVLWGEQDRVLPPSYAGRFVRAIGARARAEIVPGAGHLIEIDQPEAASGAVLGFAADLSRAAAA